MYLSHLGVHTMWYIARFFLGAPVFHIRSTWWRHEYFAFRLFKKAPILSVVLVIYVFSWCNVLFLPQYKFSHHAQIACLDIYKSNRRDSSSWNRTEHLATALSTSSWYRAAYGCKAADWTSTEHLYKCRQCLLLSSITVPKTTKAELVRQIRLSLSLWIIYAHQLPAISIVGTWKSCFMRWGHVVLSLPYYNGRSTYADYIG